jgi:hypothetical protein
MPAVRTIVRDSSRDGYKFSSLVLGVVRSLPFQLKMAPEKEIEVAANVRH